MDLLPAPIATIIGIVRSGQYPAIVADVRPPRCPVILAPGHGYGTTARLARFYLAYDVGRSPFECHSYRSSVLTSALMMWS